MSRFIEGEARTQATLFPEILDDYISEENAVRVIDVFIDSVDLSGMGFKTESKVTGRPAYHPATMLKLYVYGYLNRIQSTRRLEREAGRNVELMWLLGRLAPDFKTISDFRKNNAKAIRLVCRDFVMVCRKLDLFSDAFVAIDGSKFKAVNNRDRNFTRAKLKRRLEQIDESIDRYLAQMNSVDRQETTIAKDKTERLENKIAKLKKEIQRLNKIEEQLLATPDKQISLTDPDARSMITRGSGIVGYNVQTAVDTKHHLIVALEVTNVGNDRAQLANMAMQAKEAMATDELAVVADRGYFNGKEIKACEDAGIKTYLPKCETSSNQAKGLFGKRDFIYKPEDDEYECPAGERAIFRFSRQEDGKMIRRYWSSACINCSIKSQCTTGEYRRISRWEHEAVLDTVEDRINKEPERMTARRNTAEHPFGTIKLWMGYTHFQTRTLERVSAEMSLHTLAYNLKRVMNIMGIGTLIKVLQT
ncbi:IS1182 family transposase [Nitrosomonas marina]|uniref:Transposase, IS4 family n=1 Tax=Nitrosomonas marina TaxID=917 RepID=A0A1H8J7T5_9PROT|nr:IS1182 family transposase [Nitrosomonas marina]SEN76973.1 transposase, IS4 family [Nitrosomonas marina]